MKTYNLFISHSWTYPDAYQGVIDLIDDQGLRYRNHSVPKDDPLHTRGTNRELEQAIRNQISGTHCVLIMAGVYSTYSKWINKEIEIAKEMGKPIIAIKPWAQTNLSTVVTENSDCIVGWNSKSIVDAIRKYSI